MQRNRAQPAQPIPPVPQPGLSPLPPYPAAPAVAAPPLPPELRGYRARVALLLPMSGSSQALGKAMLHAAELAVFDVADDGFVLIPIDTRGTPDGAAQGTDLALQKGANLILGPLFSGSARQAAPIAAAAGINMVSFSNDRRIAGGNVFVMGFLPNDQVANVIGFASSQGFSVFVEVIAFVDF